MSRQTIPSTGAVVANIVNPSNANFTELYNSKSISVKDFGAVGDGITDDSQAFIDMFTYSISLGGTDIYVPTGNYRITQDITITDLKECNVNIIGTLFFDNCNGFKFVRLFGSTLSTLKIKGDETITNDNLNLLTKDGFEFENCRMNKIYINEIVGFRYGLYVTAFDYGDSSLRGNYQNEYKSKNIHLCYTCIKILRKNATAWVNENIFSEASLDGYNLLEQGEATDTSQSAECYHNQKFVNIAFEQIQGGGAIILHSGRSNHFISPRFEGGDTPTGYQIIDEGVACAFNAYLSYGYSIELSRVTLNVSGAVAGSELYGDLRRDTSEVAIHCVATTEGIIYKSINNLGSTTQNNTLREMIGEDHLFELKDDNSIVRKIGYYNQTINYVENVDLDNGFTNFTTSDTSAYAKFNYMLKDENTLEIGGVLSGGASDSQIFYLPVGYRIDREYRFPVVIIRNDVNEIGVVKVSENIVFETDITNVTRIYLGRMIVPLVTKAL